MLAAAQEQLAAAAAVEVRLQEAVVLEAQVAQQEQEVQARELAVGRRRGETRRGPGVS
jgi:hypothetical protein